MCNPESAAYKLTVISKDFEHFDSSPLDRLQWDHKRTFSKSSAPMTLVRTDLLAFLTMPPSA